LHGTHNKIDVWHTSQLPSLVSNISSEPKQLCKEIETMKSVFPWLIAGLAVGAAFVVIFGNPIEPAYADPDVERAANKTGLWGAKQRASGAGDSLVGAAKQKFGEATGNYDLADEGAGEQTVGHIKDAVGKAADFASDTLHDLNRE
jgi:uncharacterized protein YjbJ (UPF0337 family)